MHEELHPRENYGRHAITYAYPDSKIHGANVGTTWGRQDPGGPHVGHTNLAIWIPYIQTIILGKYTLGWLHDVNTRQRWAECNIMSVECLPLWHLFPPQPHSIALGMLVIHKCNWTGNYYQYGYALIQFSHPFASNMFVIKLVKHCLFVLIIMLLLMMMIITMLIIIVIILIIIIMTMIIIIVVIIIKTIRMIMIITMMMIILYCLVLSAVFESMFGVTDSSWSNHRAITCIYHTRVAHN